MLFDTSYILFMIPAFILAIAAQIWITSSYKKYSKLHPGTSFTGKDAAETINKGENFNVDIQIYGQSLGDNFDPRKNLVTLSASSLDSSVAQIAVVAHEFGHVQQKYQNSAIFNFRNGLVPVVNIGSQLGYILIIVGLILNILVIAEVGVLLFSLTAIFALITLPIEIDASKRALKLITKYNLIEGSRIDGAKSVLYAAATTYFASLVTSILNVLYYVSLINRRN